VESAITAAKRGGARIVLDAAGRTGVTDEMLRAADVLHATASEATRITGVPVEGPASARLAAEWLTWRGLEAALIDAGPDGHLLSTAHDHRMYPRLRASEADDETADEVFVGALAAALAEGRSLLDATAVADAARALTTAVHGAAAFPKRDAVLQLLE